MYETMSRCVGTCYSPSGLYDSPEEEKIARMRDKELTKILKEYHRQELKRMKILLLGTGESGKSTITKQMRIIHINGFQEEERLAYVADIRRNVKESIVAMLLAMQELSIALDDNSKQPSAEFILREADTPGIESTEEFFDHTTSLWEDNGVAECYSRSNEFQLLDSAKYFLDKLGEIRLKDYIPSDQDILRCRVITTSIRHIDFDVPDGGEKVSFSVYDVGGQRGERKKWIQVFDSAASILVLADASSFDQTLREDSSKNRLIEALEIFEQVWRNRFLRYVSIILFINKIDILAEKVMLGHSITKLAEKYPDIFPDFDSYVPSATERAAFLESFPGGRGRKKSRASSRTDVDDEVIKTAVYIKHLFMKIVTGELVLRPGLEHTDKKWHSHHSCEYYYTCAIDTNNIERVLDGCRRIIIRKHLERFGII